MYKLHIYKLPPPIVEIDPDGRNPFENPEDVREFQKAINDSFWHGTDAVLQWALRYLRKGKEITNKNL